MNEYRKPVSVRWSDLDPNFHLRHSVYYDWGAYLRMCYLTENGLTPALMQQLHIGPILFREECIFKKEIHFADPVSITLFAMKSKPDASRWTMRHEVWKNSETLSAIITIDGAWMDTSLRKLAVPPGQFKEVMEAMPRHQDFEWI